MNRTVALFHKNEDLIKFLKDLLTEHGYKTLTFNSELELLHSLKDNNVNIVVTAYDLEYIDGKSFHEKIQNDYPLLPIIFLGDTRDEDLITKFLMSERCEYMVQPIVPVELVARVKAMLLPKKESNTNNGLLTVKNLTLNIATKKACRGKKEIILTPTEFKLLEYLMRNAGNVLSREMILNRVWDTTENVSDRVVDVYIGYLREKIDENFKEKLIITTPGFGYSIKGK